jgi:hypothetical protein
MSGEAPHRSFGILDPWVPIREYAHNLEQELRKEVGPGHPLYALPVQAIAQRTDSDHVLFEVGSAEHPYAVVHLTWTGEPEHDPKWPDTQLFSTREQWVEQRMKPDNVKFTAG